MAKPRAQRWQNSTGKLARSVVKASSRPKSPSFTAPSTKPLGNPLLASQSSITALAQDGIGRSGLGLLSVLAECTLPGSSRSTGSTRRSQYAPSPKGSFYILFLLFSCSPLIVVWAEWNHQFVHRTADIAEHWEPCLSAPDLLSPRGNRQGTHWA
jgi:hypothetical protein